tara:strand:- start:301 stop:768 length:468 start_codon:yes stop_codon:yes gene_type:complete
MKVDTITKYEKAVVFLLNMDGWNLEHTGGSFEHYDAKGKTPKGHDCVVEMKFRNKYYETKLLETYKYDKLMELDEKIVKLYFVADPKGNYLFWLNDIDMSELNDSVYAPKTSLWNNKKVNKNVYMLPESLSSITNLNDTSESPGVWDNYFKSKEK